ncbi:MAG: class I SAM-dependent methyltransferase [Kiritimatiellae bacterium]|nr:class I SAM-dependent methyltransferase [Kiritimatiellia bacterium]
MEDNPRCAVCGDDEWEVIGRETFQRFSMDRAAPYKKDRLEVLFQLWCPGATEVTLEFTLCTHCGFVAFRPRPVQAELDRKYQYLLDKSPATDIGAGSRLREKLRALELYRMLGVYVCGQRRRVLDFGGGRGELLETFVRYGHECFVVDYVTDVRPGVTHLGRRLEDLPAGLVFDLVVCSHVLEHVAEPRAVLSALRGAVAEGGVVYVEVPLEIWAGPPLRSDPVTHINFFSAGSLRVLLEGCGFQVLQCRQGLRVGGGQGAFAVRALARVRASGPGQAGDGRESVGTTRALLNPSRASRVRRAMQFRRLYPLIVTLRHPPIYGAALAAVLNRVRGPK